MIKLYIYCLVLIIGNVEVGPDIGMKFHQEVMEIVSYDTMKLKLKIYGCQITLLNSFFLLISCRGACKINIKSN